LRNSHLLAHFCGEEGHSTTESDLHLVQQYERLTRQLIEKEEAFRLAKDAALVGGYDPRDPDASSGFDNAQSDGYSPSLETALRQSTPFRDIQSWLQAIIPGLEPAIDLCIPEQDPWKWREVSASEAGDDSAGPRTKAKMQQWERRLKAEGKKALA